MFPTVNLAEILSKINDGIYVLDGDQQVTFINDKASEILRSADDEFHDKLKNAAKEGTALRFEHFHRSINSWFEHQAYPAVDGGFTLISRDTTSRHRMEEALRASEERFRRVVDSNIIGVVVVEEGRITEANDVFLKLLGYTRAELVTNELRWRGLTPPEFDSLDAKARGELESTGVFTPYEKEFLNKDGRRIRVLSGGVATKVQPDARETLCLAIDVSERKRADERLRSILEGGRILASSIDCQKTFPELAEFIGSKLADHCAILVRENEELVLMGVGHSASVPVDLDIQANVNRVMTTGQPETTLAPISRVMLPMVSGTRIVGVMAIASARPDAFDQEDLRLFRGFARRAGVALENARLYQEMQKANRLKDEFVAIVSHELRTPLTPILGGVYMIKSEPQNERILTRALDLIERNAKTQVKIVDDLLDISRALSGKLRLNMEPLDLAPVIQAAIETVRPASDAKQIQINARIGQVTGSAYGDADRLQQVVWNLLANAVKFTPEGGHITVDLVEAGGNVEIRVKDSGIGIDPDFLPHVFDRFRQEDTSRTRLHGGLGLGLAIVRHLVESHGGTVHAHSSGDEQGSTFVVRLPLRSFARVAQEGT